MVTKANVRMMRNLLMSLVLQWLSTTGGGIVEAQATEQQQPPVDLSVLARIPYLTHVDCQSDMMHGAYSVQLTPSVSFHYKHNNLGHFVGMLHFTGGSNAWLAVGFSRDGQMLGSKAIIGTPGNHPVVYDLKSRDSDLSGIVPAPLQEANQITTETGDSPTMSGWTHTSDVNGTTTLRFNVPSLMEEIPGMHHQQIINFIFAVGSSETLGFHRHRGSFRLDTRNCPVVEDPLIKAMLSTGSTVSASIGTSYSTYDHKAAFAAHGFFATLAFAFLIPLALTSSWFRVLIPKWWVYIHVLSNTAAAFFTFIAVICAIAGVSMRGKSGVYDGQTPNQHMSIAHHWIGSILLVIVMFQVVNGFRRPNVQAKTDPTQLYDEEPVIHPRRCCWGLLSVPATARDRWHALHRATAVVVILFAVCQLSSGFRLFTTQYGGNTKAALAVFWVWVVLLVAVLGSLKIYTRGQRNKTRSSVVVPPKNLMPHSREEDDDRLEESEEEASSRSSSNHNDDQEFTNII